MGADQIETTPRLLSVVSYNIHQCVGSDRRRDATRIAAILKELNADIIIHPATPEFYDRACGILKGAKLTEALQESRKEDKGREDLRR